MAIYFGKEEEASIIKYQNETNPKKKNEIYQKEIHKCFCKLVENIIHTFHYSHPTYNYKTLKEITVGELVLKIPQFNPTKGMAYSWFGTIARNYIMGLHNLEKKYTSIDVVNEDSGADFSNEYMIDNDMIDENDVAEFPEVDMIEDERRQYLLKYFRKQRIKYENLFHYEYARIYDCLEYIIEHRIEIEGKKQFFRFVKDFTGLDTDSITVFLRLQHKLIKKMVKQYDNGNF